MNTRATRRPRTALLGLVVLMALAACGTQTVDGTGQAAGATSATTSTTNAADAAGRSEWASYLWGLKPGRGCTLNTAPTGSAAPFTIDAELTDSVSSVTQEADGIHVAVKSTSTTKVVSDDPSYGSIPPEHDVTDMRYVLTPDGTVQAPSQQLPNGKMTFSFDRFLVWPTVAELRQGKEQESTVTASGTIDDPTLMGEVQKELAPGETSLKMSMTMRVTGVPGSSIVTPAGTYPDVVGLKTSITAAKILNAAAGSTLGGTFDQVLAGTSTTVWFAKDVGLVEADTTSTVAGSSKLQATSCA